MSKLNASSQRVLNALRTALPLLQDPGDLLFAEALLALPPAYRIAADALDRMQITPGSSQRLSDVFRTTVLSLSPTPEARDAFLHLMDALDALTRDPAGQQCPPQTPPSFRAPPPAPEDAWRSDPKVRALASAYGLRVAGEPPPNGGPGDITEWMRRGMIFRRAPDGVFEAFPEVVHSGGSNPQSLPWRHYDGPWENVIELLLPGIDDPPGVSVSSDGHLEVVADVHHGADGDFLPLRYRFEVDLPRGIRVKSVSGSADWSVLRIETEPNERETLTVSVGSAPKPAPQPSPAPQPEEIPAGYGPPAGR